MKSRLLLFITIIITISTITAISFAQRTRDDDKPITGDFKITIKNTMAGHTSQGTTMIKGMRQREETTTGGGGMGSTSVNITQCDLKRTIQINDSTRRYLITSMASDEGDTHSGGAGAAATGAGSTQRGGVVTMTINTIDTGERREIFGFTARHLRRTTMMESGPDACQQQKMKIETDGWYINLEYGLACEKSGASMAGGRTAVQGCRDRYTYRRTGPSVLGFPLIETTTMYSADGNPNFTMTKEVIEISRQPLDAALFDVPGGYTQASTQQEMYGAPSMSDMTNMSRPQSGETSNPATNPSSNTSSTDSAAKVKVGVVEFNNKAKASVSTDSLRQQLIAVLNGSGVEAIALNASSASEAAMEAKAKGCTYILFTDISTLKTASAGKKLGGMLGRATGVSSGDSGKSEAKFDFRLVPADGSAAKLQSSSSGKEESTEASVNAALQEEARAVIRALTGN